MPDTISPGLVREILAEDDYVWRAEDDVPLWAESGTASEPVDPGDDHAVYTPILTVVMPQSFPGYASVARNRSGADPRASTIRDRDHEHAEV